MTEPTIIGTASGLSDVPRMRVLVVNHTAIVGGAERSLLGLLRHVPLDRGVDYLLACPPGPLVRAAAQDAAAVPHVPLPELTLSFSTRPAAVLAGLRSTGRTVRALRRIIRTVEPDIVHANSIRSGLIAILADARRRPPVIIHARDELPTSRVGRVLRLLLSRRSAGIIAVSNWIAASYRDFRRVAVIDNPVDIGRFTATTERRSLAARFRVCLVAQITPWKHQDHAIEAVAALHDRGVDVDLLIIGSVKFAGPATRLDNQAYEARLHELVDELGVASLVRFLGERDDVDELIASSDALLSTSEREPFGRSVAEALASGVPVIASDDGGPAELIEPGITGFVYASGDVGALADAIEHLMRHHDPAAIATTAGHERARARFAAARHVDSVADFYRSVVAGDRA